MKTEESNEEKLVRYVSNEMSPTELQEFEKLLQEDPALKDDLKVYQDALRAVEIGALRNQMNQIHETHFPKKKQISWSYYLIGAAATILIWVSIQFTFYNKSTQTNSELYAGYFEPYPTLGAKVRGESSKLQTGLQLYDAEKYHEAIQQLSVLITNEEAMFFLAISQMSVNNNQEAIKIMEEFPQKTLYRPQLNWYLGLSFLNEDSVAQAVSYFSKIQEGEYKFEEAGEIRKQLTNKSGLVKQPPPL